MTFEHTFEFVARRWGGGSAPPPGAAGFPTAGAAPPELIATLLEEARMSALVDFPFVGAAGEPGGPCRGVAAPCRGVAPSQETLGLDDAVHRPRGGRHGAAAAGPSPAAHRSARRDAPVPRAVFSLLHQAGSDLLDAEWEPDAAQKFSSAYLAGLRAAAAMLALRGRPHRARAKPTSVWVLLAKVAPELAEWSAFYEASSSTNAAIQAGITRVVTQRAADDLARQTAQFVSLVERAVPHAVR